MEFFTAIERRASVRAFESCEIGDEDLCKIVDAGRRAPSGYNHQPWHFIVVKDPEILQQLGRIQTCIGQASAAIAVAANAGKTQYWREDAAAAIENMLLATVALGYASLWVEGYVLAQEDLTKRMLGIPDDWRALAILPIGQAVAGQKQAPKRALQEIASLNRFGRSWTPNV